MPTTRQLLKHLRDVFNAYGRSSCCRDIGEGICPCFDGVQYNAKNGSATVNAGPKPLACAGVNVKSRNWGRAQSLNENLQEQSSSALGAALVGNDGSPYPEYETYSTFIGNVLGMPKDIGNAAYTIWKLSSLAAGASSMLLRHGNYEFPVRTARWDARSERTRPYCMGGYQPTSLEQPKGGTGFSPRQIKKSKLKHVADFQRINFEQFL